MDTTKIDTNSLLNMGVDPNLHPLLAATSNLPGVTLPGQTQLLATVNPLLVGYINPAPTSNITLLANNPLIPSSGTQNSLTTQIAAALAPSTVTKDPLFNNTVVSTTIATPIRPNTPTLQLAASSDTGVSSSDKITKITTPTITGTGDIGTKIKLSDGSTVVGQTTVGSDGKWQLTTSQLTNGTHQLTAIATDTAGRVSATATPLAITIDSVAPKIQPDDSFGSTVNSQSKLAGKIDGTGSTAGLTYQWDSRTPIAVGVTNEGEFEQSFDLTGLTSGTHTLTLTSTDLAGNSSTKTASVKVLLPVQLPTISTQLTHDTAPGGAVNTDKITADPQIQGTVTSTVTKFLAGFDSTATSKYVSILPQLQADGSFSLNRATLDKIFGKTLTDGMHTLHLIATASQSGGEDDDRAEGGGSKTTTVDFTFTLDTLAPQLTVTTPLATGVLKNNAKLTGTTSGTGSNLASLNYRWDNSTTPITIAPNATGGFDQVLDFTGIANGAHKLTITATDLAGNVTATAYNTTVAVDREAPVITAKLATDTGSSNSDKITSDRTILGKVTDASAVSALKAGFDSIPAANWANVTTSIQADGSFTFTPTQLNQIYGGTIPDGTHTLHLSATDPFGNQSQFDYTFTLDTTVTAPSLELATASDTGASSSDKITKINTPTISGTGEIGATIKLTEGTTIVGQTTVGTDGLWQVATSVLANGTHSLIATATDLAGNISPASAPLSLVIDTLAPQLTLTNAITTTPLKNNAKLTGTVNGTGSNLASISYAWDNSTTPMAIATNPTGGFDQGLDFTGISNGAHTLAIVATDLAGNVSTINYNVNVAVDKAAPVITAKLATDTGSSNTDKITFNPTIGGTITDASSVTGFKASFDGINYVDILTQKQADGTFTLGKAQLETIAGKTLVDGNYTLHLIATDEFGNASPNYDLAFTLDTTIAVPANLKLATASDTGASNSDSITKINTPTIIGTGEIGATIKVSEGTVIVGQTTVASDGTWQIATSPLTNGTHSLTASAIDIAGNISTASVPLSLVVDTLLPQLTLTNPLDTNPLQNNAKLVGSIDATGSNLTSINYRWDNSTTLTPIVPNASGGFNQNLDFTGINNGTHTLSIIATDVAGNVLTFNYNVNVNIDSTAPIVALQLATDSGTNTSDKITNNPNITGKVTDPSGVSAVTVSLNAGFTNSKNITTSLQSDGSFSLDKATLTQLNGGTLPDGNYQVYLQATDTFGNTTTPQTLAFQLLTIATLPTNVQLQAGSDTGTSNSDKITKNNQPTIQGNGKAGDTIQLLDGTTLLGQTTVASNGIWQLNSSTLTDGTHNLTASAIDIAGNISPSSTALGINIDTVVPNLQLAQQLAGIVLTGSSHLAGQVTDTNINTISYQFDGAPAISLPNFGGGTLGTFDTPFDFTGINDGGHNLTVTATDIAGNTVARTYGVTVARGNLLTIALLDDTGISNTDGITSDINVRGQVADRHQISRLEFSLDGSTNYTDLTAALQLDGTFRLLPAQLNSLAGGTLNLGVHSLTVRGVLADGSPVATATLNFTYQSANLDRPSLVLAKASDTGVIGDLVTSAASVDLIAKAAAGTSIKLGTQTSVADVNGIATFTGINLALGGNNFTLSTTNSQGEIATITTTITRTNPDDVILTWNHIALAAIQRENTPAPAAARVLGMVHTAMYDAVNAIEQKYGVYRVDASAPTGADEIAAAAEAAARVLAAIYPNQQAYFSAALDSSLLDGATAADKAAGVALGDTVAANIIAWRQQDGARNPAAFNPTTAIGDWQPDLPNYDGALLPKWGSVTTFGLTSGSQFRPAGDPSLTSALYTTAFNETKDYGSRDSTLRTADQTQSALFWSDGGGTYTPAGHWNDIAATAASVAGKSLLDNARLFAQLNVALADAGIAAWDAKYTFDAWRPITAIRQADKDGNPLTSADPNWVPLINTPPFPEYVSGHSTFSAAAAAVLDKTFGNTFAFNSGSVGLPNVTRSFTSFDAAAAEAGQSRIFGGIHFQFSNQDGLALGKQIGDYVAANLMLDNSLNPIQVKLSADTAAFGTTNRDRITNQVGVTGKVNLTQPNLKLQVGQANGTFVDITNTIDGSGNFQLDATKLTAILGTLPDKAYQLTFKLVDPTGTIVSANNLSFILDTTAAAVTLNPLTGMVTPTVHLTGTATDSNGGTSGRFKVDGGTNWTNFAVNANGTFDKVINAQGLTAGVHTVNVELADLAGNVTAQTVSFSVDNSNNIYASPATNPGWGRVFGNGFSLYEGNSLVTLNSIAVALGGSGKRTLDFDLVASFDKSDVKSFGKDRVAVYLVDSNNNPLALDATHPGGVPLFSLSETGAEIIPGLVRFDGTHVQIDVSNIAATSGKLVVQLLNQDGDSGSNLTLTNFVDNIDPNGISGTSVTPAVVPVTPGAAKILDSYLATNSAQLLLSNVSVDKATGKYTADLRVQNVGTSTLSQNLAVLLAGLPAGVTVANSSGIHPAGSPYLNFDTAIAPGGLAGGAISDAIRVVINDPTLAAFSFKPVVLQGAAAPLPDLSSLATLTVKVGDKIDIPLSGELAIKTGIKLPTGAITGDSHLVFKPSPDQVGSYSFTLIARNGGTETTQNVTLNVVADPITTTRVTGIIADTSQAGLANVLVELAGYQATTDAAGKFTIILPDSSAGDTLKIYGQRIQGGGVTYPFIAEKMPLLLGHDLYRGTNNQIDRPIYLPTIDLSTGTTVNPGAQTFVTNPRLAGAKVDVAAGSLFDKSGNAFAGIMTITEVPVSLTPAALPDNLHPDLVVTIQPGDMVFNTPAKLTLPNRAGYVAGLVMDLWSINPNTGTFDIVGKGKVSADRSVIETIEGGIRNSSWHYFGPPPYITLNPDNSYQQEKVCKTCEAKQSFKSEVSSQTGAVSDDRNLVSYQSQGVSKAIDLHYDSLRANPTQIFRFDGSTYGGIDGQDLIAAKVTVIANGIGQTIPGLNSGQAEGVTAGERIWLVPEGYRIQTGIYGDLSNLGSGVYQSQLEVGARGGRPNFATGRLDIVGASQTQTDKVIIVNDSDSVFGGGWNVAGLQKLVINDDSSALLIDGDGSQWLFNAPIGNIYQSPAGDFSKLERLAGGTWQRTTKDGTRYQYNAQGLMVAATDKQGNTTQHIYNALGQIQQIIDPVGLTTTFNYTGNHVTSIVDPATRTTLLSYDGQGNLISVTDPDGTKNQYGYDSRHLLSSSIDKTGQVRTGTYDEFGRAKTATREDGTIVQIKPVEVQGLLNQAQTTNLNQIPVATYSSPIPTSTYVDGNGHVTKTTVNDRGQLTSQSDEIGKETTNTYNAAHLVTSTTDAQGYITEYSYDQQGNVISVTERVAINVSALEPKLETPTSISIPAPGYYKVLATGDINNDGYIDLVTTADDGNLNILFGDINGSFANTNTIDISAYTQSNSIDQLELKDVNNDGKLDLIANLPNDGLTTYIPGDGGGGYGYGYGYGDGYGYGYGGGPVAVVTPLNPLLVFLNQGDGQFINSAVPALAARSAGFVTGDFNGDGRLDILIRSKFYSNQDNSAAPLTLYAGDGTGNFTQQSITIPGISYSTQFDYIDSPIAAGDFNGDGKTDLVVNFYDRLSLYSYDNNGNWSEVYRDTSDLYTYRSRFTIGDLNNDGKLDIVTASTTKLELLLAQGNGSFQSRIFNHSSSGYYLKNLNIADVNGDLQSDLVVIDSSNLVQTYSLDRDLQLSQLRVPIQIQFDNGYLGMTDLDRNGNLDLLWDTSSATIGVVKDYYYKSVTEHATTFINPGRTVTKSYTYNAKFNQLTSVTDELGHSTLYDLDPNTGNVLKTTRVVGQLDSVDNRQTDDVVTSYTYTSTGQLDLVIDALGRVTDYDYDIRGNLVKLTTAKGTSDQAVEQYRYDLAGNRTASIDALGHETDYIYNSMNMLLQTIDALGGTTTYTYDKMGHQTSVTDALGHATQLTYDSRGRLTSTLDAVGGITTDSYDNNGNLVEVRRQKSTLRSEDLVTKYQYDARNRLIATIAADGGTSGNTYDLNNNLAIATDSLGHATKKFYDSRNRLSKEVDALGNETKYGYNAANQLTRITDAKGNITSYFYDGLGRRTDEFRALTPIAVTFDDPELTVFNNDGFVTHTEYDKLGNVTATVDANGNRTMYTYDALNRQVRVKDAQNNITKITYNLVGDVLNVTNALNHTTSYGYDALNRQISVTDALGHTSTTSYNAVGDVITTTDALGHSTSYNYDNLDRLIKTTDALAHTATISYDALGNIRSKTDELGRTTSYVYDRVDRLTSTIDPLLHTTSISYDTEGNVLSTTDELGHTTTYGYDADNRRIKSTDALGQQRTTGYDAVGNTVANTDELGRTTSYTYDALDRQTAVTDALGHATTYTYDAVGNRTQFADALGQTTKFVYDSSNRQTQVIDALGQISRTGYDNVGNVTSIIDKLGRVTNYGYDALNRLSTARDPLSQQKSIGYDAVGNIISATDKLGRVTSFGYDALDRKIITTNALGNITRTGYDNVGNVISTTDALGRVSNYTYDALDRLIASTDPLSQQTSIAYDLAGNIIATTDKLGLVTGYSYDALNRKASTTDSLGKTTTSTYDKVGNVVKITDALGSQTQFLYDALDRQTRQIDALGGKTDTDYDFVGNVTAITDSVGNRNTYTYDALYRQLTDTNQLGKTRTFGYDAVGNRVQTIDRDGRKIAYSYDTLDRETSENWLDASNSIVKTFAYTYDAVGHLLTSLDPDSKYTYTYDAIDRIKSVDNTGTVGVPAVKFSYGYDAVGNLLTVNDSINGVNAGVTGYTYDLLNRVTKLTQGGTGVQTKRVDMDYNAVNQLTSLSRFSGVNGVVDTSYTYDLNQRLIQLSHKKGASTIASYDYSYDANNRLTRTVSSSDGTSDYSYDDTNQLTGADHTTIADEAYSYDANGNRTNAGYGTGTNNQLLTDGIYNYQYDDEGNRTQRTEIATGSVTEYGWDYRNRLTAVLFKDALGNVTKTIEYIYDGNNQRIGKRIDGAVTERYVIDRNQIALVFDGTGSQTHRYLYGTGVDQILADETGASTNWLLADKLGSIRDVVDINGAVIDHVVYDSFGKVQSQSNPSYQLRFAYTGREQDNETGLNYYRARYYDAGNGRFISEDPLGFEAGDRNLTRYVGNSPVNWIDPSGLKPIREFTPVDGDQSIFTGGGPQSRGGLPNGRGFGVNTLGGSGSAGSGNFGVGSPVRINPTVANPGSSRSLIQNSSNMLPSNVTTFTPGNNPDVPNPNTCVKVKEANALVDIERLGNKTKDKRCIYGYVIPKDPSSRGSVYARKVSGSSLEFGVVDLKSGEGFVFDGISPGTKTVWEAKSYSEEDASTLRSIYRRGSRNISNLSEKELEKFNSIDRISRQARRAERVSKACKFNFKYASNSKVFKSFVQKDLSEYPNNFPKINVLYKPISDLPRD
jgi:RHS repeat-associated protein